MNIQTRPDALTAQDEYPTRVPGKETLMPRKDPVLWSEWSENAPIAKDEAEHYAENGFLVRRDMFDEDELKMLTDTADELRDGGAGIPDVDLIREPDSDAVRTVFRLDRHSKAFRRLACDTRLAGVAEFLLGDQVYLHQSRLNYKPGFAGKEFYWHSDFETWHAEDGMPRMRAVSASVLLTPNGPHNGPLLLVPGSQGVFISCAGETPEDNYESSLKEQKVGVPQPTTIERLARQAGGITSAEGATGTVIFFECNTLHGSNGNITPDPRANAFFVYNALSNALTEPYAAPSSRPDFLANREAPEAISPVHGRLNG
ncbi:phytanoyl-CoA dioxygenase family protein [Roseovarius sp.]|uniref:phytanoyl-CoA dioxygenase family protein n=1 Tax=Roseovarius sp. TaxID=1486281 RepID=UPI00262F54D8|nr:phytanoyl-CoA dioxygenase family protein [Roseovarius sp.]MDM8166579.1 phytanoyl-CoA dioxygenase family protein [Roseovarius sp.]